MNKIKILDCTLRDGGIVTDFYFGKSVIQSIIDNLYKANIDYIELGYLDSNANRTDDHVVYNHIEEMEDIIPKNRNGIHFVAMCDVDKFNLDEIKPRKNEYIDCWCHIGHRKGSFGEICRDGEFCGGYWSSATAIG